MEYLQYTYHAEHSKGLGNSFKPYYKWNTFNTIVTCAALGSLLFSSFKPYYKWNTFNTNKLIASANIANFCFKPYYKWNTFNT